MNKTKYVFLIILAFAISILIVIFESTSYVFYEAQNIYRVYLNGKSLGIIENKKELEDYVNKKQQAIKEKYNVDNVYIPQGLKIREETTYNEKTESVEDIYNKISSEEDFTINGYTVTITDTKTKKNNEQNSKNNKKNSKEKEETTKIKEYIYILDDDILTSAVNDVVRSFVDEKQYDDYLKETSKDLTKIGTLIENVYIKEQISVKKERIPANQKIYQTEQDLARYLLFGTDKESKTYTVKSGDNVKDIAYNNKMSTEEFLIANKDITDENALLYEGQKVVISYINPVITVVEETHNVKKEKIRYKTIEREDSDMMPGHSQVIQQGKKGESIVTRKIEKQNGKITEAIIVSNEVISEPINKIVRTGANVDWVWPTTRNYTITENFGYGLRADIGETTSRMHEGIDIAGLGCGSPIYAAQSGTVTVAGWYYGYGLAVQITHDGGYTSLYSSTSSNSL